MCSHVLGELHLWCVPMFLGSYTHLEVLGNRVFVRGYIGEEDLHTEGLVGAEWEAAWPGQVIRQFCYVSLKLSKCCKGNGASENTGVVWIHLNTCVYT